MPLRFARWVAILTCLLMTGCASQGPLAVDWRLQQAANLYAGALSRNDGAALSAMGAPGGDRRLGEILASFGGKPVRPLAYGSGDPGLTTVEFEVTCGTGAANEALTATFWQPFFYISGEWRPNLGVQDSPVEGIPAASAPPLAVPSSSSLSGCG